MSDETKPNNSHTRKTARKLPQSIPTSHVLPAVEKAFATGYAFAVMDIKFLQWAKKQDKEQLREQLKTAVRSQTTDEQRGALAELFEGGSEKTKKLLDYLISAELLPMDLSGVEELAQMRLDSIDILAKVDLAELAVRQEHESRSQPRGAKPKPEEELVASPEALKKRRQRRAKKQGGT